jgi:hypothetical protein
MQPGRLRRVEPGTNQPGRLLSHRRLIQRPDRDQGPLPVELAEQLRGRRLAAWSDLSLGGHHQQRTVRQAATHQDGKRQRCRIGIVQIVQDDQQRPVGGGQSEDVDDRALQRVSGPVGVQGRRRRRRRPS